MTARVPKGKRCGCRDPQTGKPLGSACLKLGQRHHGTYDAEIRIDTTARKKRKLHRGGFATAGARDEFLLGVRELVRLAEGDQAVKAKIGDLIFESTRRHGPLPAAEVVRRRIGLGIDPGGTGETFAVAWPAYLAGKKKLRESSRRRLEQIGAHWLLPVLADVLVERIGAGHCALVFDRVTEINAELALAAAEGREPDQLDDVRTVRRVISVATQHRVYAALGGFLTHMWKKRHVIPFNPLYAIELEDEVTPEARRWTAAEARQFLASIDGRPLGVMFRIVALRGARRGEAVGFRWSTSDLDAGYLGIERPVLQIGGKVTEGRPKTKASERRLWLDSGSIRRLKEHRRAQVAERLRASTTWQDNDLVFARADGSPYPPDEVSRTWKRYAAEAGVPVIKMHEGRHSANSLAHEAKVDAKIRREQMGHTNQKMNDHYTHVLADAHLEAAEAVARLVEEAGA